MESACLSTADFADVDINLIDIDCEDHDRFSFVDDQLWMEITRVPVSNALKRKMR